MHRSKRILAVTLTLALLTAPAVLAFYDIQADQFDPRTGSGIAIIHVAGDLYAMVRYVDLDGNGQYSEGDDRVKTVYFHR